MCLYIFLSIDLNSLKNVWNYSKVSKETPTEHTKSEWFISYLMELSFKTNEDINLHILHSLFPQRNQSSYSLGINSYKALISIALNDPKRISNLLDRKSVV